jgi:hypothetical protein
MSSEQAYGARLEERPLSELVSQLSRDGALLIQQEVTLAKRELEDKLREVRSETMSIAVGGLVLYAGGLTLTAALVLLLAQWMPAWSAALLLGVLVTGLGAALAGRGRRRLQQVQLTPERSLRNVERDAEIVKEAIR